MKIEKTKIIIALGLMCALAQSAQAISWKGGDLGEDITVFDGEAGKTFSSNSDSRVVDGVAVQEDQEVHAGDSDFPGGAVANQDWDLEGIFLDGTILSVVGGFDYTTTNQGFSLGKIFLNVFGDSRPDYAIEFLDSDGSGGFTSDSTPDNGDYYQIVALDSADTLLYGTYFDNPLVDAPIDYVDNGAANIVTGPLAGLVVDSATKSEIGDYFYGANHYLLSGIDLNGIVDDEWEGELTFTCGNDLMKGKKSSPESNFPDGGFTLSLLGFAMIGLGFARRRLCATQ